VSATVVDEDTVEFAAETLNLWWRQVGCPATPRATELLIIVDTGDVSGCRDRLWMVPLQRLADKSGLRLCLRPFPPGTSRWSAITHRMQCQTTTSGPGIPSVSRVVVVNRVSSPGETAPSPGEMTVSPASNLSEAHRKKDELQAVRIERAAFQGKWNFTIHPHL
jgi:hypothetical protein